MPEPMAAPGTYSIGCNYWASHAGTAMWSHWRPEVVEEDLRQLSEAGLQVLRVFPLWPDFQPITLLRGGEGAPREYRMGEEPLPDDETGQAGLSAVMLERFAHLADLAAQYHLDLIVGLLTGWMSGRLFVPPALEGRNVLTDAAARMWETRFVRAFVRRFRSYPAIRAWDLGNECNVMAPVDSPEAAWAWVSAITSAIRAEDPSREVISGMHGGLDLWRPETLGELTDLLTTHPYPLWTQYCDQDPVDTIRPLLHSAAESVLYSGRGGRPCLVEETGVMGPMLANDETAARFLRTLLFSTWANDQRGLLWWCAYDQTRLAHAPYDWNTVERELGLIREDRSPKPVLAELGRFCRFLDNLPEAPLPPPTREAVCILPQDTHPWALAYSAYILAKQAGFDLTFRTAEAPVEPAGLYIVPSVRGINVIPRRRWLDLLERVRAGARLYISLDDGLLADFEATFGLRVESRERRLSGSAEFRIAGMDAAFRLASPIRLGLRATGAEVVGREADGNPMFTRFQLGQGDLFLLTAPLERTLAETPGAFHTQEAPSLWRIYREVAAPMLAARAVQKDHALLGLTEHPLPDGRRVIVAVNYSPRPLETTLTFRDGWRPGPAWYGAQEGARLNIPQNDAVVFVAEKVGG